MDNDVNMMAVGEMKAGAARGQHNLIYLNMSETIRAGIVSNGRLHRGEQGAAGEIGHVTVVEEPPIPCWCGGQAASYDSPAAMSSRRRPRCWPGETVLADRIAETATSRPRMLPTQLRPHRRHGTHQPGRNIDR